jgi:hypothetical protein
MEPEPLDDLYHASGREEQEDPIDKLNSAMLKLSTG